MEIYNIYQSGRVNCNSNIYWGTEFCNRPEYFRQILTRAQYKNINQSYAILTPCNIDQKYLSDWQDLLSNQFIPLDKEVVVNDLGILQILNSLGYKKIVIGRILAPLFLNSSGLAWLNENAIGRIEIEKTQLQDLHQLKSIYLKMSMYLDSQFLGMDPICQNKLKCLSCSASMEKINNGNMSLHMIQKSLLKVDLFPHLDDICKYNYINRIILYNNEF